MLTLEFAYGLPRAPVCWCYRMLPDYFLSLTIEVYFGAWPFLPLLSSRCRTPPLFDASLFKGSCLLGLPNKLFVEAETRLPAPLASLLRTELFLSPPMLNSLDKGV